MISAGRPPTQAELDVILRTYARLASLYGDVLDAQLTGGCDPGSYDDLSSPEFHRDFVATVVPVVGPDFVRSGQLAALLVLRLMDDNLLSFNRDLEESVALVRGYCDAYAHAPDPDLITTQSSRDASRVWPEFETYDVRALPAREIARLVTRHAAEQLSVAARQLITAMLARELGNPVAAT